MINAMNAGGCGAEGSTGFFGVVGVEDENAGEKQQGKSEAVTMLMSPGAEINR